MGAYHELLIIKSLSRELTDIRRGDPGNGRVKSRELPDVVEE
jgi:hypothetical protein